ncbi:alpha/beta fold hydrolase [Bradyrhizobium sp. USDA 4486]
MSTAPQILLQIISATIFSFEQHADDVVPLINRLDLGQVHLLGHSRGGGVVVTVAKTHPEVIKTMILADAVGFEAMPFDGVRAGFS